MTDLADDARPRTILTGHDQLIDVLGVPAPHVAGKVRDRLHDLDRDWIRASSLCMVATSDSTGRCDVSPKGDPPGGFGALDAGTVVIPERPGNRRADGYHNILENPHVGLLFIITGRRDTLRVNGSATLVLDAPYFDEFVVNGHRPRLCLEVKVEEVFYHCGKSMIRSGAWKPESWQPEAVVRRSLIAKTVEQRTDDLQSLDRYYGPDYEAKVYVETAPNRPASPAARDHEGHEL